MSATVQAGSYRHHQFTVDEYLGLAEQGFLGPEPRVELMDGEIFDMPPMGPEHANILACMNRLLVTRCPEDYEVRPQLPMVLGERDAPEPDLAVILRHRRGIRSPHPGPESLVLAVEIAKSSKAYDTQVKLPRYARHGIPAVWIVDVDGGQVDVYTDPAADAYRTRRVLRGDEMLMPSRLAGVSLRVSELFVS